LRYTYVTKEFLEIEELLRIATSGKKTVRRKDDQWGRVKERVDAESTYSHSENYAQACRERGIQSALAAPSLMTEGRRGRELMNLRKRREMVIWGSNTISRGDSPVKKIKTDL